MSYESQDQFIAKDFTPKFSKADLFDLAKQFQALVGGSWALTFHYKVLDRPVNDIDLITDLSMYEVNKLVDLYGYKRRLTKATEGYGNSAWKSVAFIWKGCRVEVLNPTVGNFPHTEDSPVCPLGQILSAKLEMALMDFAKHQDDLYQIFESGKLSPK